MPVETDMTYEGLFYEYSFDTAACKFPNSDGKLFVPSYSAAVSPKFLFFVTLFPSSFKLFLLYFVGVSPPTHR